MYRVFCFGTHALVIEINGENVFFSVEIRRWPGVG